MSERVRRIHSLPDDAPWEGGAPPAGAEAQPWTARGIDRMLSLQRPIVLAHIRSIRLRHPDATPDEVVRRLERRYLTAVTTGGAAVGATAVIPGVTTGVTLALSGVETAGFLESTALFAQSVAEVHGIPVEDPERARALVMALMLGQEGVDLVAQLAKQATGRGVARSTYWGDLVTKSLPRALVGPLVDQLKSQFVKQFTGRGGASVLGKALPFGVGAAVGGVGNHVLGRRVLVAARRAFGPAPLEMPAALAPREGAERLEIRMLDGAKSVGNAVAGAAGAVGRGVGAATGSLGRGAGAVAGAVGRGARTTAQRAGGMLRGRRAAPALGSGDEIGHCTETGSEEFSPTAD